MTFFKKMIVKASQATLMKCHDQLRDYLVWGRDQSHSPEESVRKIEHANFGLEKLKGLVDPALKSAVDSQSWDILLRLFAAAYYSHIFISKNFKIEYNSNKYMYILELMVPSQKIELIDNLEYLYDNRWIPRYGKKGADVIFVKEIILTVIYVWAHQFLKLIGFIKIIDMLKKVAFGN